MVAQMGQFDLKAFSYPDMYMTMYRLRYGMISCFSTAT